MLHLPTLLVLSTAVIGLCGLLLLFSWWQGRQERALLWNAGMMLLAALGLPLNALRGLGMDWVPLVLGNVVLMLCMATNWLTVRVFCGRPVSFPGLFAGALAWALLCSWPAFYADLTARVLVHGGLVCLYLLAALAELRQARANLDVSVVPLAGLIVLHLCFLLLRMIFAPMLAGHGQLQASPLFTLLVVEGVLYALATSFIVLSMVKTRAEERFRKAAYSDALTGIGNRRAFMDNGERLLSLCRRQQQPVAMLSFDLDNFKMVNDRFGHQEGDRVLTVFASDVAKHLRRSDVFARIGGEEFACLINGNRECALALAGRIRAGFAALAPSGRQQSVSIGVCAPPVGTYDLQLLLARADKALYQAKHGGRNRVVVFDSEAGEVG